jgi:integrase
VGRGVPLAGPPAVVVDPGHLPAGPEALHPSRFHDYRLGRLPAGEIENWLNDEIAAGLAPSSLHRHYRTLRRVLQVAVEKEKISSNSCDRFQPPRVPKREMVFLAWEQAVDLAEAAGERYRALIYLAVDSGMRWSELVGLRRAKVDLQRRKVRVTEHLIRLESGEWLRKETKTAAGVRSITISAETAKILAAHIERYTAPALDALVFPNSAGKPLMLSTFWQHHFQPALRAAGLACRSHDLRHTSVALAIAEGAHPKAIQARMGHSSINVTLDRYGHLLPELDEAVPCAPTPTVGLADRASSSSAAGWKRTERCARGSPDACPP